PLRLALSILNGGSTPDGRACAYYARRVGYDVVHLIEAPRLGAVGHDRSETMGELVLNASYKLLKLGRRDRDLVAIGPLRCRTTTLALLVQPTKQSTGDLDFSIELAFIFLQVSIDDPDALTVPPQLRPAYSEANLRRLARVIDGSVSAAVSRIRR